MANFHVKTKCPFCENDNDHFIMSYNPISYLLKCFNCKRSYSVIRKNAYQYVVFLNNLDKIIIAKIKENNKK